MSLPSEVFLLRELSLIPLLWILMSGSLSLAQASFLLRRPLAYCLLDTYIAPLLARDPGLGVHSKSYTSSEQMPSLSLCLGWVALS